MCKSNPTRKTYQVNCASCATPLTAYRSYNVLCPTCKKEAMRLADKERREKTRAERLAKYAKAQRAAGKTLIGDEIECLDCGSKLIKKSGKQVRCGQCQSERRRKLNTKAKLEQRKRNGENIVQGKKRPCVICGAIMVLGYGSGGAHKKTCSIQCREEKDRIQAREQMNKIPPKERYAATFRWHKKKLSECEVYAMKSRVRGLITKCIRAGGYTKRSRTQAILGCTWEEFKTHIERQFTKGMNWDNRGEWHLDHIVPISSATTEDEVIALNHFTNFRPMWAKDNIRKGASMEFLI